MRIIKMYGLCLVALYMSGCATGAKIEGMSTGEIEHHYDEKLKENMAVTSVSGGEKTNPLWTSEISSEAFGEALRQSLKSQGLLSESGKYKLKVEMLSVEQPVLGLDFTVTTNVKYVLIDSATGVTLLDKTIAAPYTAKLSDSFFAVKRLRLANEGSGKKNIEMILEYLAKLKVDTGEVSLTN